jgi:serine protease AprX
MNSNSSVQKVDTVQRYSYLTRVALALALASLFGGTSPATAASSQRQRGGDHAKLDRKLNDRDREVKGGTSRVIVQLKAGKDASADVTKLGGRLGRRLSLMNGLVVELPNKMLRKLADNPNVERLVWDRPLDAKMNRVAVTVGARAVRAAYGYTGAGVGVAVIDSGVTAWHDDLTAYGSSSLVKKKNGQRVTAFVDFVQGRTVPYDDFGHGTHVSGIIAGNGYDTLGARAGIAPEAHIVSLKVLDSQGRGVISDVIAALDYAVANKALYNIRVINLSVGAAITESYTTDPLTLAAKRAVDAGIVVVAAAGNLGKNAQGQTQYGGITAPGNAPWVLTVGASSHEGTVTRADDTMAGFSSRGPSRLDYQAKPDVVAPGVGTVSLSDATSVLYLTKPAFRLAGSLLTGTKPYLSLSGTSMASPVVAGTVALMLQANPKLTPNLVKAMLQYTAEVYPAYNPLTQGAGFLNTKGAVDLARAFKNPVAGQPYPSNAHWSKKLIWGNHRISHGVIKPNAPAWKLGVVWGAPKDLSAQNIVWGTFCDDDCDNVVWGTHDAEDNVAWGVATVQATNIVWGTYAEEDGDNIVWGTAADDEDNIVWGTDCDGADCDNVVWGTSDDEDNIVWGTSDDEDNIVWGTNCGDEECDNIVWGTADETDPVLFDDPDAPPADVDETDWESLFGEPLLAPVVPTDLLPVPTPTLVTPLTGVIGGL